MSPDDVKELLEILNDIQIWLKIIFLLVSAGIGFSFVSLLKS